MWQKGFFITTIIILIKQKPYCQYILEKQNKKTILVGMNNAHLIMLVSLRFFFFLFLPENDFCLKTAQASSEWDFIDIDNVSVLNYFQFGFSNEPFRFQIHVFIKTIHVRNVFNLSLESQLAIKTDLMQLTEKVKKCIFKLFPCSFKCLKNNSLFFFKF